MVVIVTEDNTHTKKKIVRWKVGKIFSLAYETWHDRFWPPFCESFWQVLDDSVDDARIDVLRWLQEYSGVYYMVCQVTGYIYFLPQDSESVAFGLSHTTTTQKQATQVESPDWNIRIFDESTTPPRKWDVLWPLPAIDFYLFFLLISKKLMTYGVFHTYDSQNFTFFFFLYLRKWMSSNS